MEAVGNVNSAFFKGGGTSIFHTMVDAPPLWSERGTRFRLNILATGPPLHTHFTSSRHRLRHYI